MVVGDSLGAGLGEAVRDLELVGWADRLALALHSHYPDVCVTNLARNGLTTAEIRRTQLDRAVALQPYLIIVTSGGNDLLARSWDSDTFRLAFRALLEPLLVTGAIVLTTTWHNVPLAVPMPPALARRFSGRLGEASRAVREVSSELGAPCLDFWQMPDLLGAGCYSSDGIHPNARGYLRVAEVIAAGLGRHARMPVPYSALRTRRELVLAYPAPGRTGQRQTQAGSLPGAHHRLPAVPRQQGAVCFDAPRVRFLAHRSYGGDGRRTSEDAADSGSCSPASCPRISRSRQL